MLNNNYFFKSQQPSLKVDAFLEDQEKIKPDNDDQIRKPYSKPQLEELGDLRTRTFGSFPGFLDSGGLGSFVPP